VKISYYIS